MSERERWVVYPLLFLALGAALRDKLVDRTTSKSIVCQELTIVDEEPIGNQPVRVLAKIGRAESTAGGSPVGYLEVDGVVNAKQYAFYGIPFFRMTPQAAPSRQSPIAPGRQSPVAPPGGHSPASKSKSGKTDQQAGENSDDKPPSTN
jgi:hypothetical protein